MIQPVFMGCSFSDKDAVFSGSLSEFSVFKTDFSSDSTICLSKESIYAVGNTAGKERLVCLKIF